MGLEDCVWAAAEDVRLELKQDVKMKVVFRGAQGSTQTTQTGMSRLMLHVANLSTKLAQPKTFLGSKQPSPPPVKIRLPGLGVKASSQQGKWGTQTMADGSEYQGELEQGMRQGLGR